jgi:hypothetical protein
MRIPTKYMSGCANLLVWPERSSWKLYCSRQLQSPMAKEMFTLLIRVRTAPHRTAMISIVKPISPASMGRFRSSSSKTNISEGGRTGCPQASGLRAGRCKVSREDFRRPQSLKPGIRLSMVTGAERLSATQAANAGLPSVIPVDVADFEHYIYWRRSESGIPSSPTTLDSDISNYGSESSQACSPSTRNTLSIPHMTTPIPQPPTVPLLGCVECSLPTWLQA